MMWEWYPNPCKLELSDSDFQRLYHVHVVLVMVTILEVSHPLYFGDFQEDLMSNQSLYCFMDIFITYVILNHR